MTSYRIKIVSVFLVLLTAKISSQNWEVFNHQYRYNYKFNGSPVISQVLFANSVIPNGSDTVLSLNRIGVKCTGSCPTLTVAMSPTTSLILENMPQFLQRKVKKFGNGLVMLYDTAKLIINPNCLVNQTWLFDSVNNKQAVCMSKTAKTVFGVTDSVKNILVAGSDTLVLSKNFGLIQFPKLYGYNKYYRLVGIEKATSYDSVALYGEKVPNAWDFYRFDPGDKFCFRNTGCSKPVYYCYFGNTTIISRSVIPGGYQYQVNKHTDSCMIAPPGSTNAIIAPSSSSVEVYSNLSLANIGGNGLYPDQIIIGPNSNTMMHNMVSFGQDNNGVFYKFAGNYCFSNTTPVNFPVSPLGTYDDLGTSNSTYFNLDNNTGLVYRLTTMFGVGLGQLSYNYANTGWDWQNTCQTCAVKKAILYYGNETFVGLDNVDYLSKQLTVFPNPFGSSFKISYGNGIKQIVVTNLLGKVQLMKSYQNGPDEVEVEAGSLPAGVYLVNLIGINNFSKTVKVVKD